MPEALVATAFPLFFGCLRFRVRHINPATGMLSPLPIDTRSPKTAGYPEICAPEAGLSFAQREAG